MPKLKDEINPFAGENIYERLGVSPYASDDEITERLEVLNSEIDELPKREKEQMGELIQQAVALVKSRAQRVKSSALILNNIAGNELAERLESLPKLADAHAARLPEIDISQVLIEGAMKEIAATDFRDVQPNQQLELHDDILKAAAGKTPPDPYIPLEL
jgi:hypothetical protein